VSTGGDLSPAGPVPAFTPIDARPKGSRATAFWKVDRYLAVNSTSSEEPPAQP
jgi:hypothetical protein